MKSNTPTLGAAAIVILVLLCNVWPKEKPRAPSPPKYSNGPMLNNGGYQEYSPRWPRKRRRRR